MVNGWWMVMGMAMRLNCWPLVTVQAIIFRDSRKGECREVNFFVGCTHGYEHELRAGKLSQMAASSHDFGVTNRAKVHSHGHRSCPFARRCRLRVGPVCQSATAKTWAVTPEGPWRCAHYTMGIVTKWVSTKTYFMFLYLLHHGTSTTWSCLVPLPVASTNGWLMAHPDVRPDACWLVLQCRTRGRRWRRNEQQRSGLVSGEVGHQFQHDARWYCDGCQPWGFLKPWRPPSYVFSLNYHKW